MGFGTLFFGYFLMFAFSLSQIYFFADIFGALISLYALSKLSQYHRDFARAMIPTLAFLGLCGLTAVFLLFNIGTESTLLSMLLNIGKAASACIMHIFLFRGIRDLARGADSDKLLNGSARSLRMTMIYYVFYALVVVCSPFLGTTGTYASVVVYLYWVACLIVNLMLIYRCFGILIPADEDEDAQKRSRFAFINKVNDKFDSLGDSLAEFKNTPEETPLKKKKKKK